MIMEDDTIMEEIQLDRVTVIEHKENTHDYRTSCKRLSRQKCRINKR